jgi:hypothetical protein
MFQEYHRRVAGGQTLNELIPKCPFLDGTCEECYVVNPTSETVGRVIFYCGGEYERCEIYRNLIAREQRRGAPPAGDAHAPDNHRSEGKPTEKGKRT